MTSYRVEVLQPTSILPAVDDPAAAFERVWALIPQRHRRRLWSTLECDGGLFVKGLCSLRGHGLRGYCQGLRTRRERHHLERMAARGLPVPELLAFGQETRAGFPTRSFLVQRLLRDAVDLDRWLATRGAEPGAAAARARRALLERLGALVAQLHAANVFHRDLACRNILVCEAGCLHLVDCPRAWIDPPRAARTGLRRSDLFRVTKGVLRAGAKDADARALLVAAGAGADAARVVRLARGLLARRTRDPSGHGTRRARRRGVALRRWLLTGR